MRIKRGITKDLLYSTYKKIQREYRETKNYKKRLKLINGGYKGTKKEYREQVLSYWRKYRIKPKRMWYALYCNGKEGYDPHFVPESIWVSTIRPYFNDMSMQRAYTDKGMLNRLLTGVKMPETIAKNVGGYYYDGDGEHLIGREEAEAICLQENQLIFKPSLDTYGGSGIIFYDKENSTQNIHSLFDHFGTNYVVQRIVRQHPDLAKLNDSSLNTIRVLSLHFKNQIHILSVQLRIGGAGAHVDNIGSGGCACPVNLDGSLTGRAVTRQSVWTDKSPTGIKLNTVTVPSFQKVIDTARNLHSKLPYFDLIGWDFAVDESGEPVLIEFNVKPGQNQIGSGEPTFGVLSDEVFDEVFLKRTKRR